MATRMGQNLRVLEGGKKLPAHVVRDDSVLQSKHMQGRDQEGSTIERLVLLTRAAETSDKYGKAEVELRLQFLFLKRADHGHKSSSLTKAKDAIKWTLDLHSFSYSRQALVESQAFLTLLLCAETPSLDIRKPPTPLVLIVSSSRTGTILLIRHLGKKNKVVILFYQGTNWTRIQTFTV